MSPEFVANFAYDLRLRRVTKTFGQWLVGRPLRTLKIDFVDPRSGTATVTFSVSSAHEPDFGSGIVEVVELEIHNGTEWIAPKNNRFIVPREQLDRADVAGVTSYDGVDFLEYHLARTYAAPITGVIDENGEREYAGTVGQIANTMIAHSQDPVHRKWGKNVVVGFSDGADSAAVSWGSSIKRKYKHGMPFNQVLDTLLEEGLVERESAYHSTIGYAQLNLYKAGRGTDFTTGSTIVDLGVARLKSAPQKNSIEGIFTRMTANGEGQRRSTNVNESSELFELFGHFEGWVDASGVEDYAEIGKVSVAALENASEIAQEHAYQYDVQAAPRHLWPYVTYRPGDYVFAPSDVDKAKFRVAEIQLQKDGSKVTATVIVGKRFTGPMSKLRAQIRSIRGGTRQGGSGGVPNPNDTRIPNAPTGVEITAQGYWAADGAPRGMIAVEWDAVESATQGDPIAVNQYEVWTKPRADGKYTSLALTDDLDLEWFGYQPGAEVFVQVRARSTRGQWSAFSAPVVATIPNPPGDLPAPDAPTVTADNAGIVYADWNGLLATAAPPPHFDYVLSQVGDAVGGPFAAAGQQLLAAGTSTIGGLAAGPHWVRLMPYDRLGQPGTPSNAIPVTVVDVLGRKPAAPANVEAVSEGYWDGVTPQSRVTVSWDEVTEGEDGMPINVRLYEVWGERDGVPAHALMTTGGEQLEVVIETLAPLADWTITVRAQSEHLAFSSFSAPVDITTEAPPMTLDAPTTPTVTSELGLIHVYWDGRVGEPPIAAPAFLRATVAEMSDDWDGDDGTWIPIGALLSAGQRGTVTGVAPGEVRWLRLVAVDMFGRSSAPSEVVEITVQGTGETIIADSAQVGMLTAAIIEAGTDGILQLIGSQVEIITDRLAPLEAQVDAQGETVAAVQQRFTFDSLGLTIASPDSQFKLRLDNDSLDFLVGDTIRAFLTAEAWNAQRVVTDSLRVGLWEFIQENPPTDPSAPGTGSLLMKYVG